MAASSTEMTKFSKRQYKDVFKSFVSYGTKNPRILDNYLARGMDINHRIDGRGSLMHILIHKYDEEDDVLISKVTYLISKGINLSLLNSNNETPLHVAIDYGYKPSCIKILIDSGCPLDVKDVDGKTALMFACRRLNNVAISLITRKRHAPNERDINGNTAIMIYISANDLMPPSNEAESNSRKAFFEILFQEKDLDVNAINNEGSTMLHILVQTNELNDVGRYILNEILRDGRLDIYAEDKFGWTARCVAAEWNNKYAIVKLDEHTFGSHLPQPLC